MDGSQTFTAILEGGSPWGFSIQGGVDHRSPLRVGKVTPGGRASKAGLVAGDYILFVNNEDSRKLKHLQAQQIIKKSLQTVTLVCTKIRPGVTSPAVSSNSSFTFPTTTGGSTVGSLPREPVIKAQPIARPKPPQPPAHARSASMGTSSECTTTGSSSPHSNVDVYDIKFQGMDVVCLEQSHPQENGNCTSPGNYQQLQGVDMTCIDRSHPMQNGDDIVQVRDNQHISHNDVNANALPPKSPGKVRVNQNEQMATPPAIRFNRLTKDALASAINKAAAERVRRGSSGERESEKSTNGVSQTQVPVSEEPAVQVEQAEQPQTYHVGIPVDKIEEPVSQVKQAEQPLMYQFDDQSDVDSGTPPDAVKDTDEASRAAIEEPVSQVEQVEPPLVYQFDQSHPTDGNQVLEEPVSQVEQVEPPLVYQFDQSDPTGGNQVVEEPVSQVEQVEPPLVYQFEQSDPTGGNQVVEEPVSQVEQAEQQPVMYNFDVKTDAKPPLAPTKVTTPPKKEEPGHQPVKEEEPVAIVKRDPGWYKQMFQQFQNTVEENFPGDKSSPKSPGDPEYVYDHRGLKVRKDSLPRVKPEDKDEERKKKTPTPDEEPVYTYDYRGLRVRTGSLSKAQESPPAANTLTVRQVRSDTRPRSASAVAGKLSVSSGTITDDILSQSKRATSYKTDRYSTGVSRDYWKEKDKDHQEWDQKRRNSQEYTSPQHQRSYSSGDYVDNMTHMHPLLRAAAEEESTSTRQEVPSDGQPKLFERIDASKLQGALSNATVMGQLEQEGVPSHLLPAVVQAQKEAAAEEAAKKKEKPAPGPKAKALFDFDAQSAKELSFKKGDYLDLLHTVDDNWLEAKLGGSKGIIPRNYVKVLTLQQYREMISPEPPKPTQLAKALFDFQGQSDQELSFSKGDNLHIERKIDANWYEGYLGDLKGRFPVAYVQITEGSS